MQSAGARTPNSILRTKRGAGNKENDAQAENNGGQGGARKRERNRRVSFAPDDELQTMHLYPKGDNGAWTPPGAAHNNNASKQDSLAAAALEQEAPMPRAPAEPLAGARAPLQPAAADPNVAALSSFGLLSAMSPGAMLSPMSMDLTSNSCDPPTLRLDALTTTEGAPPPPGAFSAGPSNSSALRPRAAAALIAGDFTANITSAVPGLSTLVEEDEEDGYLLDASGDLGANPLASTAAAAGGGAHGPHLAQHDATVSMELTMAAGAAAAMDGARHPPLQQPAGVAAAVPPSPQVAALGGLGSPVLLDEADEPEAPPSAARPAAGAGAMTPTSPFALGEMFGRRGGGGGGGGAGGAGAGAAGGDAPGTGASVRLLDLDLTPDESMQKKWGFTPGADDTLDVSHGRKVMGEATYNHVYGAGPTGELTRAVQQQMLQQSGAAAAAGWAVAGPSRSTIAAVANAAFAAATTTAGGAPPARGGSQERQHHQQQQLTEMTIHLLADEEGGALGFGGAPSAWAPAQRAPSQEPPAPAPPAGARSAAVRDVEGAAHAQAAAAAAVATVGGSGSAAGATHNFTDRLLAEGNTTRQGGSTLQALMQRVQQRGSGGGAAVPLPAVPPRELHDLTSASGVGGAVLPLGVAAPAVGPAGGVAANPRAVAGGGADHTSGSMDFGLLGVHGAGGGGVGGGTGGTDLDASMHTLDDFAAPPDLHAHLGVAPVTQHSGSMAAMAAAAAAAAPHVAAVAVAAAPAPDAVPDHVQVPPVSFQEFLAMVEVRFLDDMRRRTSFVQPFDLGALAGGKAGLLLGAGKAGAPPSFLDALESVHGSVGTQVRLAAGFARDLSSVVEVLQRRAAGLEQALSRSNPPLFRAVQLAGEAELEDVRERMRQLKRVCRQRTLLEWKKRRISQEQAASGALRDQSAALEEHLAVLRSALEQGMALEAQVEEATAAAAARAQHLHDEAQTQQATQEQETVLTLCLAEKTAACEQRASQLAQLDAQHATAQEQVTAAAQKKAELMETLQRLQAAASQADPASAVKRTPRGGNAALAARLASARAALDAQLSTRALQLDLTQHNQLQQQQLRYPAAPQQLLRSMAAGEDADDAETLPEGQRRWSLVVHGLARVTVRGPAAAAAAADEEQAEGKAARFEVVVQAVETSPPLVQLLLPSCLGAPLRRTVDGGRAALSRHVRGVLASLDGLRALVEGLHDAQLHRACAALRHVGASDDGAQLLLAFLLPGALGDGGGAAGLAGLAGRPPCKVELRLRCGPELLTACLGCSPAALAAADGGGGGGGRVPRQGAEEEGAVAAAAWAPLGVARPGLARRAEEAARAALREAAAVAPLQRHQRGVAAAGAGGGFWGALCGGVVAAMSDGVVAGGEVALGRQEEAGREAAVVTVRMAWEALARRLGGGNEGGGSWGSFGAAGGGGGAAAGTPLSGWAAQQQRRQLLLARSSPVVVTSNPLFLTAAAGGGGAVGAGPFA